MSTESPARRVLVVCDVGPEVGIGHAMRCLALGEELAHRGVSVTFASDSAAVPFVESRLRARGFASVPLPVDAPGFERLVESADPLAVVVDSYLLPPEVYAVLSAARRTLAIVDGDPGPRPAHLYLDQNIDAEADHWSLPPGAQRLAGLRFALLRDDVLAARPAAPRADEARARRRVLAVFGGTDAFGAGPVAARALVDTGAPFDLTLVAGNDRSREEAAGIELRPGQHLEVVPPTDRLPELVTGADLVVSAAGTSSWELLCLGAPCALVCVADNQLVSYRRLVGTGAVLGLGTLDRFRADASDATVVLRRVLADPAERRRLSSRAWHMIDGHGRARVADALLGSEPLV